MATPTFTAMPIFQTVALARYPDTVDWSAGGAWVYAGYLASLLRLGLYGLRRTWFGAEAART